MPERFGSHVYPVEVTKLMKDAFDAAWPNLSQAWNQELARQLLASAIIDQIDAGSRNQDEIVTAAIAVLASAGIFAGAPSLRDAPRSTP